MYFEVTEAQYIGQYRIRMAFEDGSGGIADLANHSDETNVFRSFLDMSYFRDFRVEDRTIVLGKGELDIAPERLYSIATGSPVSYHATKDSAV